MGRKCCPGDDWPEDVWDDDCCEDCYDYHAERRKSSRKCRYLFAGILIFLMWLVKRDKKKESE